MATKKAVSKKPSAKRTATKTKKAAKPAIQSFKLAKPDTPFFTFAITRQTLYWSVISGLVFLIGLWVIQLQMNVNSIYDTIEINQAVDDSTLPAKSL